MCLTMTAMDITTTESTEAIGTGIETKGRKIIGDVVENEMSEVGPTLYKSFVSEV